MWGSAFRIVLKFIIALPNHAPVLAVGMPDLRTIKSAAVTTDDLGRKYAIGTVTALQFFTPSDLILYHVKFFRIDNRSMAVFNIILRRFSFIVLPLLCQEIHGDLLLQQRRAFVFLIL